MRFLPLGHRDAVTPYIGAGAGVFAYRYSESGQFLATDSSIFRGSFVGSGTATGPVILGGLRAPVGSWDLGFEVRYQNATGDLPFEQDGVPLNFSGGKIDLAGSHTLSLPTSGFKNSGGQERDRGQRAPSATRALSVPLHSFCPAAFDSASPAPSHTREYPSRKAGRSRAISGEHVAALCLLFDQDPRSERVRAFERREPDVAVALVQEIADREACARGPCM